MTEKNDNLCGALLILGDDHGDNDCTFSCTLPPGHEGMHGEVGTDVDSGKFIVQWERDARQTCSECGRLVKSYTRDGIDRKVFCDECFEAVCKEFFKDENGGECITCGLLSTNPCGHEDELDAEFAKTRSILIHCPHWRKKEPDENDTVQVPDPEQPGGA